MHKNTVKRRVNYILKTRIKHCTKEILKTTKIIAVALILIIGIILIKYKPLYKVEIDGVQIGYVKNKKEFNSLVNKYVENEKNDQVAFVTLDSNPSYELKLVENTIDSNEDEVLETVKENTTTTYTAYGITVNNDIKTYVKTEEDAENTVKSINEQYNAEDKKIDINVKQIYSEEALETVETDNAVETVTQIADVQIKEQEKQEEKNNAIAVVNEVAIITKPVSGSITSRYAEVSRVRSGAHTGLDIAAPSGTDIKVCSNGKVTFASYKGSYGNLIKVKHENGVETWYAHCSKLYAKVGQEVKAGDIIAAVGSTGNSTGSHLHFEIRINDNPVNPQKYIYNK